jgi:dipeptidyl aminopeptidase/acylaminoacyl peptidase
MRTVRYLARDGLPIEGFLTMPKGSSTEKPPPLVVLAHGGPWVRDVWEFNSWVQFLASRGYAVFQPNYRGSAGYDWRFPESDAWDFIKMHHDVTDGVGFLVRSRLVDPNRIAIMGGSFGGYLAICGAAYEGSLYRCAISLSGIFDWERVIKESRVNLLADNPQMDILRRHLGDPSDNATKFNEISPLRHIDQVKIPVFVYHGYDDDVANISESQRLVSALKEHGVPHEVHFLEDEGHGLSRPGDATEIFTDIEAFLAKNMRAGIH